MVGNQRSVNKSFFPGNQARLAGEGVRQLVHGPGKGGSLFLRRLRLRRDLRSSPEASLKPGPMFRSAGAQVANYFSGFVTFAHIG